MLGVILNDKLTATGHVDNLLSASTGVMYALRVLRSHDIPPASNSGGSSTSGLVTEPLQATWLLRQGLLQSATELFSDADDALNQGRRKLSGRYGGRHTNPER